MSQTLSGGLSQYTTMFSPYHWNSYNTLSPYSHGEVRMQVSSPKIETVLLGQPLYGETFAIHGAKRTGKTLLATFILVERLRDHGDEIDSICSNVTYDFSTIGYEDKYQFLTDIEQVKGLKHSILFIDEIRRYADSYLTQSQQSRLVSNLLADTGKQKDDFYYTDQSVNGPPGRIRTNIDYVLAPMFDPYAEWVPGGPTGAVKVYMFNSLQDYDLFFHPFIPGQPMSKPIFQFAFWAPPFYKFYDTEQKIEQWHNRFKPKEFMDPFLEWKKQHYPDAPIGKFLLDYWNVTDGIGLSSKEIQTCLAYCLLEGIDPSIKIRGFKVKDEEPEPDENA